MNPTTDSPSETSALVLAEHHRPESEKRRMSRADSAQDSKCGSTKSAKGDSRYSTSSDRYEPTTSNATLRTPSGQHCDARRGARDDSVHQTRSPPDSIRSWRRREVRPGMQRMHTSPLPRIVTFNVRDTTALHARSCKLMNMYHGYKSNTAPAHTSFRQSAHHRSFPCTPQGASPEALYFPTMEHEENQPKNCPFALADATTSLQSVTHWTSASTKRREYAEIDKQNRGLRKWVKKLIPSFLSKPSSAGFYCEKNGSDAGSVRRYRLDLPDEEES